jgi:hypothetical protein
MAIKFHMAGGAEVDMVLLAVKFFPVASGEEFRDLLVAISESPADAPKPTKLDQFAASHPTFPAAFATAATPASFADEEYRGIDAFVFVDKAGHRQAVRYIMAPEKLVHLTADEAARKPPDFLVDDLPQRIAKRPVVFHLKAQLAAAGDQTRDPSQPWPDNREVADLGVLTLDTSVVDSLEAEKNWRSSRPTSPMESSFQTTGFWSSGPGRSAIVRAARQVTARRDRSHLKYRVPPMANLTINGEQKSVDAPPEMPLLWVLRDILGLMEVRFSRRSTCDCGTR